MLYATTGLCKMNMPVKQEMRLAGWELKWIIAEYGIRTAMCTYFTKRMDQMGEIVISHWRKWGVVGNGQLWMHASYMIYVVKQLCSNSHILYAFLDQTPDPLLLQNNS